MRGLGILLICLLLWPLTVLAQSGDSDRGYIQGLLEDNLSGPGHSVRLDGFEGALSSRATVKTITISDETGAWLTMRDVALTWSRAALLRGAVEIEEISVGRLELPRPPKSGSDAALPSPEAPGPFALPELPVSLRLAKLSLSHVTLGEVFLGETVSFSVAGSAELAAGSGAVDVRIKRLDRGGAFNFQSSFSNASRELKLALDLNEPRDGIAARLLSLPDRPSVALTLTGDGPLSAFAAQLGLRTDGVPRLSGQLQLTGTSQDNGTRFATTLGGDIAALVAPQYRGFLGPDVRMMAEGSRGADGGLRLDVVNLQAAALQLEGRAALDAEYWPQLLDLRGRIAPAEQEQRVTLPLPGTPISVRGADLGLRFDAEQGDEWQFETRMEAPWRGGDRAELLQLSGAGTLSQSRQQVTGAVDFAALGLLPSDATLAYALGAQISGHLEADWQPGGPLKLDNIGLTGADYGLSGSMTAEGLDGAFDLKLAPDLELRANDLSRFASVSGLALQGRAELGIKGTAAPVSGAFDLDFSGTTQDLQIGVSEVDPLLSGDGQIAMRAERSQAGLRLDPVQVTTGTARITARAELRTDASQIEADLRVNDLSLSIPELQGAGRITATAAQTGDLWTIASTGQLPGATEFKAQTTLATRQQHLVSISGQIGASTNRIEMYSALVDQNVTGALKLLADGTWNFEDQSFSVAVDGSAQDLNPGISIAEPLLRGTSRFSANADREQSGNLRLSSLSINAPGVSTDITGNVAQSGQADFDFRLALPDLGRVVPEIPGPAQMSGTVTRGNATAWTLQAQGEGPGGIRLTSGGSVSADGQRLDLSVEGGAPLGLLSPFLQGQSLSGLARFDLLVNGPPALSSVSGQIRTDDARLFLPEHSLTLSPIIGDITLSNGTAQIGLRGDLSSGGRVRVSGPVRLTPPYDSAVRARLSNVTLREADLYTAQLEGELTLQGALGGAARIGGDVLFSNMEVRIPDLGPSYAALDGLRHQDLPRQVRQTLEFANLLGQGAQNNAAGGPAYPVDMTVRAPARLFVRGRGLDAELGGALRLIGTTANVIPQGQFDLIRGRLDLLGRRLTLTRGALRMRGSFDPVIDFAATSTVEGVGVTLALEGIASAPELTVTSTPPLPQDEALSLFLFGKDPTQISALQAVQLAAAIRTLSGRGGLGFSERLRQGLGVDNLDVGTDTDGNAQAQIGAYVSDRIYTDVTVNSAGNSQIRLNIDVTPNVTVRGRATSQGDTGIGVFFERDY